MSDAIDNFGLTCPQEAKFYICSSKPTQFIGCCTSDPCKTTTGDCPTSDLRAASFDTDAFDKIPAQECVSTDPEVKWYTCTGTTPPFLGCCGQNPCAMGSCPGKSLRGARLSGDEDKASSFISGGERMSAMPLGSATTSFGTATRTAVEESATGSATVSTTASASVSATTSLTSTSTSTSLAETTSPSASKDESVHLSKGAIVGIGIVSTIVIMFLIGLIAFWFIKKRKRNTSSSSPPSHTKQPDSPFPSKKPFHESKFPDRYHSPQPQAYFHHRHYNQYHELGHSPAYYTMYPDVAPPSRSFSPRAYPNYMGTPPPQQGGFAPPQGGFAPPGGHFTQGYVPFSHPRTPPVPEVRPVRVNRKHSITAMADYFTRGRPQVAELSGSN